MFRLDRLNEDPATVVDGLHDVQVGDKVTFAEERRPYRVRAISKDRRWVICTKPFNLQHTVLYCVLDRKEQRRGPDDRLFGPAYETDEDIAVALDGFENHDWEVTVRRDVRLNVVAVNGRNSFLCSCGLNLSIPESLREGRCLPLPGGLPCQIELS